MTELENATRGVTCNAICPGWVLTRLVQKQVDAKAAALGISNEDAKRQLLAEREPSLPFTTLEKLGALALFLCSVAAYTVRGVVWNMDGGWWMGGAISEAPVKPIQDSPWPAESALSARTCHF